MSWTIIFVSKKCVTTLYFSSYKIHLPQSVQLDSVLDDVVVVVVDAASDAANDYDQAKELKRHSYSKF